MSSDRLLTTTEAGRLVSRSGGAVRDACLEGSLPATKVNGFWWVKEDDLRAWDSRTERRDPGRGRHRRSRTDEVLKLLADWDSASADEIAKVLQVHAGNARKWLAILAAEGRVERRPDGQWTIQVEAPLAS